MLSGAMQIELSSVEADALHRIPTTVPAAYEAYLRGRWYVRHNLEYTLDSAIDAFDRAVQEDPNFGEAHASLAWALVLLMESDARTPRAVIDRAALHIQRALALGARNSEAFRAWALIEQYRGSYEKSVQRLEEAVETAPSDAEAQRRLSVVYSVRGNTDGAIKAARKAVADDPRNLASHTTLGMVFQFKAIIDGSRGDEPEGKRSLRAALKSYEDGLLLARDRSEYASAQYVDVLVYLQRPDRAAEILNDRVARTRESYVDYYKLARIYQTAGRAKQEWEGLLRRAKEILLARLGTDPDDGMGLSYLALVHTRLGEFKEATAASRRAEKIDPGAPEVLYNIARMYALQRDKVQALTYLSKAINLRYRLADVLDMDYFNLHSEPDFLSSITR
jgi:tetratricopeptide (TPR) repeat protein